MIRKIIYKKQVIAIFTPRNHIVKDAEFITDQNNPLQVGLLRRKDNDKVSPHSHLFPPTTIDTLQEVIYVVEGKLLMSMYDQDTGEMIEEIVMNPGDSIVHMAQAHGVRFLEESLIFEVKQGPYPGADKAKIHLETVTK